jgi:hypothetical protein
MEKVWRRFEDGLGTDAQFAGAAGGRARTRRNYASTAT